MKKNGMRKFLGTVLPAILGSLFLVSGEAVLFCVYRKSHDPIVLTVWVIIILITVLSAVIIYLTKHGDVKLWTSSRSSGRGTQVFMVLLLLSVGLAMAYAGWRAIDRDHFEIEWVSSGSVGLLEYSAEDYLSLYGWEARRVGIGLISLGAMVVIWGLLAGTEGKASGPLRFFMSLSFGCFLLAMAFIFPPWRLGCLPVYFAAAPMPLYILTKRSSIVVRRLGRILNVLFIAVVVSGFLGFSGIGAAIFCGILADAVFLLHVLVLFPEFRDLFPNRIGISD